MLRMLTQLRLTRTFARTAVALTLAAAMIAAVAAPSLAIGGQTGGISGIVIGSAAKVPLAGVLVTAVSPSGRGSTRTDSHGTFAIIGLQVDTYTVSFELPGYEAQSVSGVTIQGDQTITLNPQTLAQQQLRTIGRVSARAANSVFQPGQTQDSVSVSGSRVTQATGKAASTDFRSLAQSIPGVQLTGAANGGGTSNGSASRITIRGGLSSEVGYQLDGVDFTDPYLLRQVNNGRFNGLGSLQVIEGAGDSSQGNVGSGVLNVVTKRGTYPATGLLDVEGGFPNFNHQFAVDYGFATPNGRFSDYISYHGLRYAPYFGLANQDAGSLALFYSTSFVQNDDLLNNFVFKFGKSNNQSLQVLYDNKSEIQYGNRGGFADAHFYPYDPYSYLRIGAVADSPPLFVGDNSGGLAFYQNRIGLEPYVPGTDVRPTGPFISAAIPARFLKFEYQNNLSATSLLAVRAYNENFQQIGSSGTTGVLSGSNNPRSSETGGSRAGVSGELTKVFGERNTVTIGGRLENAHPTRYDAIPTQSYGLLDTGGAPGQPSLQDFSQPANANLPISAANPCPAPAVQGAPPPCYLYSTGQFYGAGVPRIPFFGINYFGADYQTLAVFIRDQWSPSDRVKFDLGLREDTANYKQGRNPFNPSDLSNPQDVDPSFLTTDVVHPRVIEPRAAASYQFDPRNSVRFGYGRSVNFQTAGTFGTPATLYGVPQQFFTIPALGNNPKDPTTWTCGSGYNTARLLPNKANFNPGGLGGMFACQNYAQQLFWLNDQNLDAPDVGNNRPPVYNNFDVTYQHQFRNGVGARLTGYFKRGYDVPATDLLKQILDPTTGVPTTQVFAEANVGINKTSGIEFALSTPEKPVGLSAYVAATYTNIIQSTPPLIANEDTATALITAGSTALGDTYRAAFVSPFVINAGLTYRLKNGLRINPIFFYDRGFPIGTGNLVPSGASQGGGQLINGKYYNIPQTNLPAGAPSTYAYNGAAGGPVTATNYVDPVNPGNDFHPNIAASRGTPESSAAGGFLSRPRLYTNLDLEWKHGQSTFGLLATNLFGNTLSEPGINPFYQPVATGVAGPNSGNQPGGNPLFETGGVPGLAYAHGVRNLPGYGYGTGPLIELPNANPTSFLLYFQHAL